MIVPSSILLIKLRHHGDVLLATPVARLLKSRFPECAIDFLIYEGTGALLENNPDIRHLWNINRSVSGWRKYYEQIKLLRKLSKQDYTWVIHLSDQLQGAWLAKLLRPQESVGLDYPKRRHWWWRTCFTRLAPLFESNTRHAIEQNVIPLKTLELSISEQEIACRLVIREQDRTVIQELLADRGVVGSYIVVHPAARWFFKCWEDDRFAAVIQWLADQGHQVIITASPEVQEMELVSSIFKQTNSAHIVFLAGLLTLPQLAALIDGARLFLGVDSVPMHIAAALQKETVVLFGPSKIKEWHPWKTKHHLIDARHYGPLIDPDEINTKTTQRYLSNIPVEPVIEALKELLG